MIRVPIGPLESWFRVTYPAADHSVAEQETLLGFPTASRLGEACGVGPATIWRWRRHGIPYWSAADAAHELGWHPTAFWSNWLTLDPSIRQRRWVMRDWWAERKQAATVEAWQWRLDCVGSAGDQARAWFAEHHPEVDTSMFTPNTGEAAA